MKSAKMTVRRVAATCIAALLLATAGVAPAADGRALEILKATGVKGGLVVHVGCGDGTLTTALRANDSYLVHGLDADAGNIATAREHIRSKGLCGKVSVEVLDGKRLPYADNLVNLLVADELGGVTRDEVLRVLAPLGVAYIGGKKTVKPWPEEIDEWTHFLHDASNNAVARDTRVGPPRRLKWVCGPLWSRSHEFIASMPAMVSGGGRVFYVVDEGLTGVTPASLPDLWVLIGRDAFNGVELWKRPLPDWRGGEWKSASMRGRPGSVPRRIVADGPRLWATLSHSGPLVAIDAATGKTLQTIAGAEATQEIALSGRTLVLRLAALEDRRAAPSGSIAAVDADTGQLRWKLPAPQFVSQSLAVAGGRAVYSTGAETVCLALADGKESWRAASPWGKAGRAGEQVLILHGEIVLEGDGSKIVARSAETGKEVWRVACRGGSMRGQDMFVAQGCVWHAAGEGIAGYDLATGKQVKLIDPSSVQTPGHHLRCYRAKATERFLITQFRGAEFVSLTGGQHVNNDWIRGMCRYGVMPSNGLLYVPPNPCFCYPGVKPTGLLALAPAGVEAAAPPGPRLVKGPAYSAIPPSAFAKATADRSAIHPSTPSASSGQASSGPDGNPQSAIPNPQSGDWPTYRHDAKRSGVTATEVAAQVAEKWRTNLGGRLTPPVAADGRLYVAARDEHTLHALDAGDGSTLWRFTAGGRIDSPPTIDGGKVLFGCADGSVYCLRADDGLLAWRFRAAPRERRVVSFNRLESAWRVHGSILVVDGVAYGTAGRSTFLDGGILVFGLDPRTGKLLHETRLDTYSPTRVDYEGKPFIPSYHIEGTHSDILLGQGGSIFLGQYKLDAALTVQDAPYVMGDPNNPLTAMDITKEDFVASDPDMAKGFENFRGFHRYMEKAHAELAAEYKQTYGGMNMGDRRHGAHIAATGGFLDDTWFNRTYWMNSTVWPGWYHANRAAKTGQLLVVGPKKTYSIHAFPTRNRQSPLFEPGTKGYLLQADHNDTEPVLDHMTRGATKGMGYTRLKPPAWHRWVPVRVRGMVLAGSHLFVAGPPDVVDPADPMGSFEGRKGGALWAVSAADGRTLSELPLDSPPVFDGLIAAGGRLYVTTMDGKVVCMGKAE